MQHIPRDNGQQQSVWASSPSAEERRAGCRGARFSKCKPDRDLKIGEAATPMKRSVLRAEFRKYRTKRKRHLLIRFEICDRHNCCAIDTSPIPAPTRRITVLRTLRRFSTSYVPASSG